MLTLLSFSETGIEPWNLLVLAGATLSSYIALLHYASCQFPRAFRNGKRSGKASANSEANTAVLSSDKSRE